MKKLFLTLVLAFVGIFAANAQVWMGGSASTTLNKEMTRFAVAPEIGYSFQGVPLTIAIGANYGYCKTTTTNVDGESIKNIVNPIVLSPYIRYSICTIKNNEGIDKFGLFLDLTGDFGLKECKG